MNQLVLTPVTDLSTLGENVVKAMQALPDSPKRILHFDNFILARAETNKNRDRISAENLGELASTLPLNWIDIGHDTRHRTGFYISAKVDGDVLSTSGIIWTDDDPSIPQKLASGELQASLEADADKAECSKCHRTFASEREYCEHLMPLENRFKHDAERWLYGMKATGGALTPRPAGTETKADPNRLQMIAHVGLAQDHSEQKEQELIFLSEAEYNLWLSGHPIMADDGVLGRKLGSKERKKMPASKFGVNQKKDGKTVKRFPINDCEHARKALQLLPKAKNLSSEERAQIRRKANAYLDKHCRNKSKSSYAQAVLAAQRFFAMEWANTPTEMLDGSMPVSPFVPPVISPLMYYAGPELQAAPMGKHPVAQVAEQVQKATEQKIIAKQTASAEERTGALSMTWITTPHASESKMAW